MKLLFHIGSPKAGSSSIQSALIANASALQESGVMAWRANRSKGAPPHALATLFMRDDRPMRPRERLFFRTRDEARDWSRQNWDRLAQDLAENRPELTVLSSEFFFAIGAVERVIEHLRSMFSEIHILAYVRDPVDFYRSTLDQRIRDGDRLADLPLPTAFATQWPRVIRRYQTALGPQNVILRAFRRSAFVDGDLIADLAAQIGGVLGRPVTMPARVPQANESLCAVATLWLMAANEAFVRFGAGDDREQVRRRLALVERLQSAPALQGLPKLGPPPDAIANLVRQTHAEAIAFFNDTDAGRASPITAAPAGLEPTALDEAEIRAALRRWLMSNLDPTKIAAVLDAATV